MLQDPEGVGFGGAHGFNGNIQVAQNHGFRSFQFVPGGILTSLIYGYVWNTGINRAVCAVNTEFDRAPKDCPFPNKRCSHGFYAYYGEDYFQPAFAKNVCVVNGVIDGFGRCVIGSKGYRSEYATLVAFTKPFKMDQHFIQANGGHADELEALVTAELERAFPSVPIFNHVDDLRQVIALPGRPPRNAE